MKSKYVKALSMVLAAAVTAGSAATAMPAYNVYADEAVASVLTNLITDADVAELTKKVSYDRVSVHDPSIVYDNAGTYYIFGSHMGVAKTTDLMNWTNVTSESTTSNLFGDAAGNILSYEDAFKSNNYTGAVTVKDKDGNEYQVDLGSYDVASWISDNTVQGNMWAPDVIYNEAMGKWCMYLSLNGATWNSAIILLTADSIEGPYVYEAPIVFTGFNTSDSSKSYKNTDLEVVLGELDELPEKYQKVSDSTWGTYWPHAIDPCVFYDDAGKLWMAYGSWSGGIYVLELDENTGLRDYTTTYESDFDTLGASVTSDEYFGKKIAGGYYVSGEGAYIEKIGNYYYLFMSYGFYSPEGGYNMRVFKSENPDGPYTDANGVSAIFDKYIMNYSSVTSAYNRGLKLMGNYKWSTMSTAEIAQGHNSAIVTEDGKSFVIYHTKFNDGTAGHQVRVHQLFTNANGDLLAAPYEYSGETLSDTGYTYADVAGDYEVIAHEFQVDYADLEYVNTVNVTLNGDGTVSGAYTGTYTVDAATANITLNLDGTEYSGVIVEQAIDGMAAKTMCFTIASKDGLCVWGSKLLGDDVIVAQNVESLAVSVPTVTYGDITLPTEGANGAEVTWTSSNSAVLTADGVVTKQAEDTDVTLTLTVSKGETYYTKDYTVTVKAAEQSASERLLVGSYFENEEVDISTGLDQSISIANPFYNGVTGGLDVTGGLTVEFDVKSTGDVHVLGTILSFLADGGNSGRLYFTPGSYLGYNGGAGYFDANLLNYGLVTDYIGESATVALNFNNDGFKVIVNGETVYDQTIIGTETGAGNVTDYSKVVSWLNEQADAIYFGYGSWWNAAGYDEANCTVSNVKFYVEPVNETAQVKDSVYAQFGTHTLTATDITYYENPFYNKNVDEVYVEYTINVAEDAAKNGWDGVLSFFNQTTGGRVSIQTAPYVCYNDLAGNWMDINQPGVAGGTNAVVDFAAGEDHTVGILINADGIVMTVDGEQIATGVNGSGASYSDLINFIETCDKLTVGVGEAVSAYWNTEACTISDITVASGKYETVTMQPENTVLATATDITYLDNAFYGKDLESLTLEYTVNFSADAAKNGWDGLFSFFNQTTGGRVSIQSAPYICYNSASGDWIDISQPGMDGAENAAVSAETGTDHNVVLTITADAVTMTFDGKELPVVLNGSGASFADMLAYVAECDKLTIGVGEAVSAYWNTELCTLSNMNFTAVAKAGSTTETPDTEVEEEVVVKTDVAALVDELRAKYDVTGVELADTKLETATVNYNDNTLAGKELKGVFAQFTLNFDAAAAKNGWDGVLSFYNSATGGRISVQTAPYICFNDGAGNWSDINTPGDATSKNVAPSLTTGEDHVYNILLTEDTLIMQVDGVDVAYSVGGTGATNTDLLAFIAQCDQITLGTGEAVTGYWFTENCTISDITVEGYTVKETTAGAAADYEYTTQLTWGNNAKGAVKVTNNTDETIKSWKVAFEYDGEITQIWNATIESHEGNVYVVKCPAWNKNLEAGKSAEFGFLSEFEGESAPEVKNVVFVGVEETVTDADVNVTMTDKLAWCKGYSAAIIIKNTGSSLIDNWTMEFDFDDTIETIWGAKIVSHIDNHYVISNQGFNAEIRKDSSAYIGFIGTPANDELSSDAVISNVTVTTMK